MAVSARAVPLPAAYAAQLSDHEAWIRASRAMLATSELIWPRVQEFYDERAKQQRELEEAIASGALQPKRFGSFVSYGEPQPMSLPQVFEFFGFAGAYLMNAGYAVENFLKAIRIKRLVISKIPVDWGTGRDAIPRSHDYVEFARDELKTLTVEEIDLLKRLGTFVQWAGRYPISLFKQGWVNADMTVDFSSDDRDRVQAFCGRLTAAYAAL